jgi:hypothetical protein
MNNFLFVVAVLFSWFVLMPLCGFLVCLADESMKRRLEKYHRKLIQNSEARRKALEELEGLK